MQDRVENILRRREQAPEHLKKCLPVGIFADNVCLTFFHWKSLDNMGVIIGHDQEVIWGGEIGQEQGQDKKSQSLAVSLNLNIFSIIILNNTILNFLIQVSVFFTKLF